MLHCRTSGFGAVSRDKNTLLGNSAEPRSSGRHELTGGFSKKTNDGAVCWLSAQSERSFATEVISRNKSYSNQGAALISARFITNTPFLQIPHQQTTGAHIKEPGGPSQRSTVEFLIMHKGRLSFDSQQNLRTFNQTRK